MSMITIPRWWLLLILIFSLIFVGCQKKIPLDGMYRYTFSMKGDIWQVSRVSLANGEINYYTDDDLRKSGIQSSPDGNLLLYRGIPKRDRRDRHSVEWDKWDHSHTELFVVDVRSNESYQLTDNPVREWYMCWSPDSDLVAYVVRGGDGYTIRTIRIDGSDDQFVTYVANSHPKNIDWCPDGSSIAYFGNGDQGVGVYTVGIVDGVKECIVQTTVYNQWPRWSPDGSYLAVEMWIEDGKEATLFSKRSGLYVYRVDDGMMQLINEDYLSFRGYEWSPNAPQIACCTAKGLFVINVVDGETIRLFRTFPWWWPFHGVDYPHWSADGSFITFSYWSGYENRNDKGLIVPADGSARAQTLDY